MEKTCSSCGQNLEPEPSFYTGAMYVSYAFSVAICVTLYLGNKILGTNFSTMQVFFTAVAIIILFAPVSYQLSRAVWAYFFIKKKQ